MLLVSQGTNHLNVSIPPSRKAASGMVYPKLAANSCGVGVLLERWALRLRPPLAALPLSFQ